MQYTKLRVAGSAKTPRKPPRNRHPREYASSGHYALKSAVASAGGGWLDELGPLAAPIKEWRHEMLAALGGDAVSPQRKAILDALVVDYLLLCSVDRFIATMPSAVNRSKRALFPIIAERARLADGLTKRLQVLGLDRLEKSAIDLNAYLAERYGDRPEAEAVESA